MWTPKYRKHSTRNYAFVEIKGKRIRLPGAHGSGESKAAWHAICSEMQKAAAKIAPAPGSLPTVAGVCLAFIEHCEPLKVGKSRGDVFNMCDAARVLIEHFGSTPIDGFGPKTLKELQSRLIATRKKKPRGSPEDRVPEFLSRNYINCVVGRIKRVILWAVSEELAPPSLHHALATVAPIKKNRTVARETKDREPVAMEYVIAVVRHLRRPVRKMVRLQVYTGVRSQSVCYAKPEQFDTSSIPWKWTPRHKMEYLERSVEVPIGPRARRLLTPLLAQKQPDEYLFSPRDVHGNKRFRDHYDSQSYGQAVEQGIKLANRGRVNGSVIPHWTPHQIRHSMGDYVRKKYGLEATQAVLQHESLGSSQIYAKRRQDLAVQIAEEIG